MGQAKADAAKRTGPSDGEGRHWNDTLTVNLYIASPMMAAYSFAKQAIKVTEAEDKIIKGWFKRIVKRNECKIEYYKNGQISVKCTYNDGKKDGEFFEFYHDGVVWEHGYFSLGEYDGEYSTYFVDGKRKSYELYKKGDRLEAIWYGIDGTIHFSANFETDYLGATYE